jgi:hypothetical protein
MIPILYTMDDEEGSYIIALSTWQDADALFNLFKQDEILTNKLRDHDVAIQCEKWILLTSGQDNKEEYLTEFSLPIFQTKDDEKEWNIITETIIQSLYRLEQKKLITQSNDGLDMQGHDFWVYNSICSKCKLHIDDFLKYPTKCEGRK